MIRINLLPVRVSKKKQAATQQIVLAAAVLVVVLAANMWWASSRASVLAAREAKVKRTKVEITQLEKIIGEVNDIKQQQAAVKDKLAVLERLKAGRSGPVRMLDALASMMPKRLWLRRLDEKEKSVTLEGSAASIDDVSTFMSALGRSEFFSKIELKKTAARPDGRLRIVDFTITATANYTPGLVATAAATQVR